MQEHHSSPAALWVADNIPQDAAGFAAVLADLDAPAPAFLASVPIRAEVPGVETPDFQSIRSLHATCLSETAAEAADQCGILLAAFRALLSTEEAARLLAAVGDQPIPTWRQGNARLGFRPASGGTTGEETVYKCGATGQEFALSAGAPVPCLFFDNMDGDGEDPTEHNSHPSDRNPAWIDLHPGLAARGAAVVLAGLWGKFRDRMDRLAHSISITAGLASLLAGLAPAEVGENEVPRALLRYERDGEGGYVAVPAGWRDAGAP